MVAGQRTVSNAGSGNSANDLDRSGSDDRRKRRAYDFDSGNLAPRFSKISFGLHALIWVLVGALLSPFLYWALIDTAPPISFISAIVKPDSGAPGARVQTEYRVNILRDQYDCSLDVERSWQDNAGRGWPSGNANLAYNAGPNTINLTMVVPMDAAAGAAAINNRILYSCNPWQRLFPQRIAMPLLSVQVIR